MPSQAMLMYAVGNGYILTWCFIWQYYKYFRKNIANLALIILQIETWQIGA